MDDDGHVGSISVVAAVDDIRNHNTGGAVHDDEDSCGQLEEGREKAGPWEG